MSLMKTDKRKTNMRLTAENREFLEFLKSERGRQKEQTVNEALDAMRKKYKRGTK